MNKTEKALAKEFMLVIKNNIDSIDLSRNPIDKIAKDFEEHLYDLKELEEAYEMIEIMRSQDVNMEKVEELLKAELKSSNGC